MEGSSGQLEAEEEQKRQLQLRVVTLNVWGLRFLSKDRTTRLRAIADILAGRFPLPHNVDKVRTQIHEWDIVCLQEVWMPSEAHMLAEAAVHTGLKYSRIFHSGALGSGLMICSRLPIAASRMHPYKLNGHPLRVLDGDWFVGKGAASITVHVDADHALDVYVTHLYAPGEHPPSHRLAQVWELAQLVNSSRQKGRHVLVCGDLNSRPQSKEIQLLTSLTSLIDTWPAARSDYHSFPPIESLHFMDALILHGVTSGSPSNTYSSNFIHKSKSEPNRDNGKKLDYILASPEVSAVHSEVAFTGRTFDEQMSGRRDSKSFSDHFGISALLSFESPPTRPSCEGIPMQHRQSLEDLHRVLCARIETSHVEATRLMGLFGWCVLVSLGSPVAASFQPLRWLNWIFPLLSTAAGIAGATALYAGFVGGRWERNGLRSVAQEVKGELDYSQV